MYAKKNSGKKIAVIVLAAVLLFGCGVGATLAWLTAQSETVTNTFTVGDVNIELKEHDLVNGQLTKEEVVSENTYKIVPGDTQPKDPFVRVEANSEDSWIFVQIMEVNNTVADNENATKYVEWAIDNGVWTHLGTDGNIHTYVMTNKYTTNAEAQTYNILLNKTVTYNQNLTKANLEALDKDSSGTIAEAEMPQLIFKAFAVQAEAAGNAADAWNQIAAADKLSNP